MIDRSYLPFQAAREYQDPGMQKWMGFFLSEHTSSLHAAKYRVDFSLFGEVRELSRKEISIKTSEGYRLVQLDNILQIQLLENHIH